MCARFTLRAAPELLLQLFHLNSQLHVPPRYNVAPTQDVLAVRVGIDGANEFTRFRWGLIPSWANDASVGQKLLNARSESVGEKPAFRDAVRKRRCLIVADGFYEWKTINKRKMPYHVYLRGHKPFAFAGIWERWQPHDGQPLETCSILTTVPNEMLRPLHDRMPVIVKPENYGRWLDLKINQVKELADLFQPYPSEEMELSPVSPRVNRATVDDAACVEPLLDSSTDDPCASLKPVQRGLFDD